MRFLILSRKSPKKINNMLRERSCFPTSTKGNPLKKNSIHYAYWWMCFNFIPEIHPKNKRICRKYGCWSWPRCEPWCHGIFLLTWLGHRYGLDFVKCREIFQHHGASGWCFPVISLKSTTYYMGIYREYCVYIFWGFLLQMPGMIAQEKRLVQAGWVGLAPWCF